MPGQNIKGTNTNTVVAVEAMIGQATSLVASYAARAREEPVGPRDRVAGRLIAGAHASNHLWNV